MRNCIHPIGVPAGWRFGVSRCLDCPDLVAYNTLPPSPRPARLHPLQCVFNSPVGCNDQSICVDIGRITLSLYFPEIHIQKVSSSSRWYDIGRSGSSDPSVETPSSGDFSCSVKYSVSSIRHMNNPGFQRHVLHYCNV